MAVWLLPISREVMVEHCKAVYPNEGCGILVGKRQCDHWFVLRSIPVPNRNEERSRDRFEISPRDYLRVEKEVRREGMEIVGIFHSHPDVPPFPSMTDAQFAWEGTLNIIVGVFNGQKVRIRAHIYDGEKFNELPVYVPLQGLLNPEDQSEGNFDVLDLTSEVEPFVSIGVREHLSKLQPNQVLLVKFTYEPALRSLPRSLTLTPHQILQIRWNEEGVWELLVRAGRSEGEMQQSDFPTKQ
ncbi:MAG: Mov34/MPN/PAD-1 family protein [Armatimonadota bacterium]|nr:Mov34/MPN/PAD-1 family protein [Armatimonadota bacterium]MDW8142825.1 Mov34/MPN/PAD-1 family protein [Armatimonadota bacterium]